VTETDSERIFEVGDAVGGCIIEGLLGSGGMGMVFRAKQHDLGRQVAIKIIRPAVAASPGARDRFIREARTAAAIDHPNILPIYDVGQENRLLYITMRFVPDGDLSLRIKSATVTIEQAVGFVGQVASALDGAHAAGIVHRDVKPENVLVAVSEPGREHVYLSDFGLARFIDEPGMTLPGAVMGTPWYMSPEQAAGARVDARTDVYALSCVLFEELTGRVPYAAGSPLAVLHAHQFHPVPSVCALQPALPIAFEAVISRGLAKDPDERYPSAGDLARAAASALAGGMPQIDKGSVASGEAAPPEDFPEPTHTFIQTQAPRMTADQFDSFLQYLRNRGWPDRDIREFVLPWAPRVWKDSRPD
jgi:serine/threonine protein kinase